MRKAIYCVAIYAARLCQWVCVCLCAYHSREQTMQRRENCYHWREIRVICRFLLPIDRLLSVNFITSRTQNGTLYRKWMSFSFLRRSPRLLIFSFLLRDLCDFTLRIKCAHYFNVRLFVCLFAFTGNKRMLKSLCSTQTYGHKTVCKWNFIIFSFVLNAIKLCTMFIRIYFV